MTKCYNEGGMLFAPKSAAEDLEVHAIMKNNFAGYGYWIGITDKYNEGT